MTKVRSAFTFENALTQVAGHIGWERTAEIVGAAERTVRNWSDPDTTSSITLDAALKLDEEFHRAGGEGTPFLYCYATRLEATKIAATPGLAALIASAASSAKETGEAIAAVLAAATPNATIADMAIGERELEEGITALTNSLAALRARREALVEGQGKEGTEPSDRTLEVVPPMQTA
jgi:hypothetical protein